MKPHLLTFLKIILCLFALCAWQGSYATPTTPTSDFIDNKDGTVTHKKTGLIWQRCAVGQTWTGSFCDGKSISYNYKEALTLISDFAGQNDWRLPNIVELQTIVEWENINPAINNNIFPDLPRQRFFWSSSPSKVHAWSVDFSGGRNDITRRSANYSVRLVRSGQWTFGSLFLTTPSSDFVNNGDGTVTHKRTGLMWQRCAVGQTRTDSDCQGSAKAYSYNQLELTSIFAGYSDWRLPTIDELLSIVEYGTYAPAINQSVFPKTPSSWFISSSSVASSSISSAWSVNFTSGTAQAGMGSYVRLVRGGQSFLGILPDGNIGGDKRGWIPLSAYGDPISTYMGVTAYMNDLNGLDEYQCAELTLRFARDALHLTKPVPANGIDFAENNKDQTGYIESNGSRTDIVARYYPKGSTTPPVNGSIISQTSVTSVGHVSIAKKIVKVNDNTLDVYLFEQNWIWADKAYIADSRKMRFSKNAKGQWIGKTKDSNKAVGWLNPEAK